MAIFGEYETVAELSRSGSSCVYRARPADGGWDLGFDDLGTDSIFALKTFRVRNAEDAGGTETSRFLERVRAQKRVATAGALHWAPIIDTGKAGPDAYYIAPYYPRTAAKIAREPGAIDADSLYGIVAGTLEGLLELRQNQGRPHGNLKSSNILIKGENRIDPTDIQLTDPAREEDATIAGEVEDLYNLGEIIHELVLGIKFPGQQAWPIPPSRPWTHLGKKSNQWLAICNHLLSPRAAENWLRVDDILEEMAPLRPARKPLRSRKLWVAAAAFTVVAGLCVGEYFRYSSQWRNLCTEYANGIGALDTQLSKSTPKELAADSYMQDRVVRPLADARDHNVELDPRLIAASEQSLTDLANHPPFSLSAIWKTEKAWRIVRGVQQSLAPEQWTDLVDLATRKAEYEKHNWQKLAQYTTTLSDQANRSRQGDWAAGIAAALEGHARLVRLDHAREAARSRMNHLTLRSQTAQSVQDSITEFQSVLRSCAESDVILPSALAADRLTQQLTDIEQIAAKFDDTIPLLAEAAKRQRAYEIRGWTGPARALASLADRAHPDGDLITLNVDFAAAKRAWELVETQWTQIEQRRRLFETSGDRILATYREFIAQSHVAEQGDLASLVRRLEEINSDTTWAAAAKVVAGPDWSKVDIIEFARKSDAHRGFTGHAVATPQILRLWLSEVESFGTLSAANTNPSSNPANNNSQLASASIKPDPAHIGAGEDTGSKRPIETVPRHPTTIAIVTPTTNPIVTTPQKSPTTVAAVTPSKIVVTPATKPAPDPEQLRLDKEITAFITECREVALSAKTREIKELWSAKNDELASRLEKDHKSYNSSLKTRRDTLRRRLLQLDAAYQSASAPLAIKPAAFSWSAPLTKALQAVQPQRSAALKEISALADSNDSRFDAALARMVDDDEQWRASAGRLIADAARVDELLGQGYLPADKTVALGTSLAAVRSSELYKTDAVRRALDPLIKPTTVVETETAPATLRLLASTSDLPLGARLAAWSKIGEAANKEILLADVKLADTLLADLQKKVSDKNRLSVIKTQLESDLRRRWESLLDHAGREQDIEAAIALRDQITGIDPDKLAPRSRFNLALHDFRAAMAAARGADIEKQLAPAGQKLKQLLPALDPADAKASSVVALSAEIDRLSHPAPIDFAHLGPMSDAAKLAVKVAWSATPEEGSDKVTYRATLPTDAGKEEVALVFRRVQPSASAQSSWVCTTETSLGVFCDLITASAKWTEIRSSKLLTDYDPMRGDPRQGPRVWEWPRYGRSGEITWTRVWLSSDFIRPGLDHYPPEIAGEYNFNRTQIGSITTHERDPELNPSRRQPMQQVSAKAAQLAAAAAGCRIPTIAEWQAAWKSADQRVTGNLRDRTWRLELEHMSKLAFNGPRPDAGMFVPDGEKPSDVVFTRTDGTEFSDGVLWFRQVPETSPNFVDLVGNVAEFVTGEADKIYVIGGSSLSPRSRPLDRAFGLAADQEKSCFSDVGFRLAFSGPVSGVDKLKDAVAGNWYLTAR